MLGYSFLLVIQLMITKGSLPYSNCHGYIIWTLGVRELKHKKLTRWQNYTLKFQCLYSFFRAANIEKKTAILCDIWIFVMPLLTLSLERVFQHNFQTMLSVASCVWIPNALLE